MRIICLFCIFAIILAYSNGYISQKIALFSRNRILSSHISFQMNKINFPFYRFYRLNMASIEATNDQNDNMYKNFLPDESAFNIFFKSMVPNNREMNLEEFMQYKYVKDLLSDGLISQEDIDSLWISSVGDAQGLNEKEAYEMLCMVLDLPDPEFIEYIDEEYAKLTISLKSNSIDYITFLNWSGVQDVVKEGVASIEEITDLWRDCIGDLNTKLNRKTFGKINNRLEMLLETKEDVISNNEEMKLAITVEDEDVDVSITSIDIWSSTFDPESTFDDEFLVDLREFYSSNLDEENKNLSIDIFLDWKDMKEVVADELLTEIELRDFWSEALRKCRKQIMDFDTFLRLNVYLDVILEEREALATSTDTKAATTIVNNDDNNNSDDGTAENFYKSEFKQISDGKRFIDINDILNWKEISELIEEGTISENQIRKIFNSMPKEEDADDKLSEKSFLAFNGMLDLLLDATGASDISTLQSSSSVPDTLVSEPLRPMPSQGELQIGSLESSGSSIESNDLELMEVLDQAENMLNSGSFDDFDKLIGDVDDPRLDSIREKNVAISDYDDGPMSIDDIKSELIQLGTEQQRCGLEKPNEEIQTRLRELVSGLTELTKTKINNIDTLKQDMNGKWKLLYTNSEMFEFYNGISGFVNVFPASKFESLVTSYESDGFLNESQFYEKLSTPLGDVDVTVFSNWDLVKEVSFMTNTDSIVLRSYANRVTAGPFEYEAQENWKSLRTMSMNELIYLDSDIKILRNCGALRIFFVYKKV